VCAVAASGSALARATRLRGKGKLEVACFELQRMPALSHFASYAQPSIRFDEREQRSTTAHLHRRLDGVPGGCADDERGWCPAARLSPLSQCGTTKAGALLHDLSESVFELAPGLRDGAPLVAAGGGPNASRLRVVFPSARNGQARFPSG